MYDNAVIFNTGQNFDGTDLINTTKNINKDGLTITDSIINKNPKIGSLRIGKNMTLTIIPPKDSNNPKSISYIEITNMNDDMSNLLNYTLVVKKKIN